MKKDDGGTNAADVGVKLIIIGGMGMAAAGVAFGITPAVVAGAIALGVGIGYAAAGAGGRGSVGAGAGGSSDAGSSSSDSAGGPPAMVVLLPARWLPSVMDRERRLRRWTSGTSCCRRGRMGALWERSAFRTSENTLCSARFS